MPFDGTEVVIQQMFNVVFLMDVVFNMLGIVGVQECSFFLQFKGTFCVEYYLYILRYLPGIICKAVSSFAMKPNICDRIVSVVLI